MSRFFYRSAFCLLLCLLFLPFRASASGILLMFDQSGSMTFYDSKKVTKLLLVSILRSMEIKGEITLSGFHEDVKPHISIGEGEGGDYKQIAAVLSNIPLNGMATDFLPPFEYVARMHRRYAPEIVVIVSDGKRDIWDRRHNYLSKKILNDSRYEDLNSKYRQMRSAGIKRSSIYDALHQLYLDRNSNLTDQAVAELKKISGMEMVFLDISGNYKLFEKWAEELGGQYMVLRQSAATSAKQDLKNMLMYVLKKTAKVENQPLTKQHEELVSAIVEQQASEDGMITEPVAIEPIMVEQPTVPEIMPEEAAVETAAEALPEPVVKPIATIKKELPAKEKPTGKVDDTGGSWMPIAITLVAAFLWFLYARKKQPDDEQEKREESVSSKTDGLNLEVWRQAAEPEQPEDEPEAVMSSLRYGIDLPDRRFAFRVDVPADAMTIECKAEDGKVYEAEVLNISMERLLFKTEHDKGGQIVNINCPRLGVCLAVEESSFERREDNLYLATIDSFVDNIDDRMKWVELLTRIGDKR